jgi:hypothetical protein
MWHPRPAVPVKGAGGAAAGAAGAADRHARQTREARDVVHRRDCRRVRRAHSKPTRPVQRSTTSPTGAPASPIAVHPRGDQHDTRRSCPYVGAGGAGRRITDAADPAAPRPRRTRSASQRLRATQRSATGSRPWLRHDRYDDRREKRAHAVVHRSEPSDVTLPPDYRAGKRRRATATKQMPDHSCPPSRAGHHCLNKHHTLLLVLAIR